MNEIRPPVGPVTEVRGRTEADAVKMLRARLSNVHGEVVVPGDTFVAAAIKPLPKSLALQLRPSNDNNGLLIHLNATVQLGAEKETPLAKMAPGHRFEAKLSKGYLPQIATRPGAADFEKADDQVKAQFLLSYKSQYGKFPALEPAPGAKIKGISFEPNDWIEVQSNKFETVADAKRFLDEWGWGHIHTSFKRGASPVEQKQQVQWVRNANLYIFLASLERRGAGSMDTWPYAIKSLSIPTENQLRHSAKILAGEDSPTTAFSKHFLLNVRGSMYGEPNRIGMETRGGVQNEKERVLDSLFTGLSTSKWGNGQPQEDDFQMPEAMNGSMQPQGVPRNFTTWLTEDIAAMTPASLTTADAQRLTTFVAKAQFSAKPEPARMMAFDQRICLPLLRFEKLGWLNAAEKARVVTARKHFIEGLSALEVQMRDSTDPVATAPRIANLVTRFATEARLGEAFGNWLDAGNRVHHFR